MRPIRLARIALEAELLRLGYLIRRLVGRAVLGFIALALLMGAVLFAHIAAWYWLRESLQAPAVALIFVGIDIALALLCALLAVRSAPGIAEREALAVRERALDDAADALSISALVVGVIERVLASRSR